MRVFVKEGSALRPATFVRSEPNGLVCVRLDGASSLTHVRSEDVQFRSENPKKKAAPPAEKPARPAPSYLLKPPSPSLFTLGGEDVRPSAVRPPTNAEILSVLLDKRIGYVQGKGFFEIDANSQVLFDSSGNPRMLGKSVPDVVFSQQGNLSSRNTALFDGRLGDFLVEHPDVLEEVRDSLAQKRTKNPGCRCTKKDVQEAIASTSSARQANPSALDSRLSKISRNFGYKTGKAMSSALQDLVSSWDEGTHGAVPLSRINREHTVEGRPCTVVVLSPGKMDKYFGIYRILPLSEIAVPWVVTHLQSKKSLTSLSMQFARDPRYPKTVLQMLGIDTEEGLNALLEKATRLAVEFEPDLQLTDAQDARIGPAVVDLHGLAIAGLARILALKILSYSEEPQLKAKLQAYQNRLRERLGIFGVHRKTVERLEKTGQALDLCLVRCLCEDVETASASSHALARHRIVNPSFAFPALGQRANKSGGFSKTAYDLYWLEADASFEDPSIQISYPEDGSVLEEKGGKNLLAGLSTWNKQPAINEKLYRASNLLRLALGDIVRSAGGQQAADDLLFRLRGLALSENTKESDVDGLIQAILAYSTRPAEGGIPSLLPAGSTLALPSSEASVEVFFLPSEETSPKKPGRPKKTSPPAFEEKATSPKAKRKKQQEAVAQANVTVLEVKEESPSLPPEVAIPLVSAVEDLANAAEETASSGASPQVTEKVAESAALLQESAEAVSQGNTQQAEALATEAAVVASDAASQAIEEGAPTSVVETLISTATATNDAANAVAAEAELEAAPMQLPLQTPAPQTAGDVLAQALSGGAVPHVQAKAKMDFDDDDPPPPKKESAVEKRRREMLENVRRGMAAGAR